MDLSKSPPKAPRPGASKEALSSTGLLTRLVALLITLAYAMLANSLALWSDFAATLIGFLGLMMAWLTLLGVSRGKFGAYSYGYNRLESIASLGIAALMLLSFLVITFTAAYKFIHPSPSTGIGLIIGLASNSIYAVINGWIWWRNILMEKRSPSPALTAQRRLYTFQCLSNIFMVVSLGLIVAFAGHGWTDYVDPAVSVVLGLTLLLSATKTLQSSALNLLDRALEERDQLLIMRALAEHFEDYTALHGIRTRSSGGRQYVELFLEFDPIESHGAVQDRIDRLQRRLESLLNHADVVIMPTRSAPPSLT